MKQTLKHLAQCADERFVSMFNLNICVCIIYNVISTDIALLNWTTTTEKTCHLLDHFNNKIILHTRFACYESKMFNRVFVFKNDLT